MTNSAVRGLYAAAPNQNLARGDYVIVRLPEGIESLHVDAGFRLLKRVRGFPGESYTVDEEYLRTHDDSYRIYHKDGLPQLEAGTYTIPDGTLLLLNDTDDSFDSRYLGTIESSQIDKKVFLLLSYEPFLKLIGRGKI
jgi:putative conjugal transfer protein traF